MTRLISAALVAAPLMLTALDSIAAETTMLPQRTPSPPGAEVYFIEPADGATLPTTFTVKFGLKNMGVAPAGTDMAATGHHHLLIDQDLPPFDQPMGGDIMHFGGGQTETEITLPPGPHSLRLLVGDKNHVPHDPPVYSEQIDITTVE